MVTSKDVKDAEMQSRILKLKLDIAKADVLLYTNWEETLGNKKPTVGEKEAYCLMQTEKLGVEYIKASVELHHLQREYDEEHQTGDYCVRCL